MTTIQQNTKTIHTAEQAINQLGFTDIYTKDGISADHDSLIIGFKLHNEPNKEITAYIYNGNFTQIYFNSWPDEISPTFNVHQLDELYQIIQVLKTF